tara:strand:+ start:78 stop:1658 length:1581 start_codon:yes stop_codon:yes gene_type:complete
MYYYENYNKIIEKDCSLGILENKNNVYIVNNNEIENNRAIHNDIVYINNNKVIGIKERSKQKISGILYMNKNKSYGKNKKNMNYYKFKPLSKKFPDFLVPSSLNTKNKVYIVISFNNWDITSKYPIGICENIIGEIGNIDNEYEVLLHKYDLKYKKLKFDKKKINNDLNDKIDKTDYNIITIDPKDCVDNDDGLHININNDIYEIGVHITDVSYYINDLSIFNDKLTSSIYYNNNVINMIPEIYSNNICSLRENTKKRCISLIYKYNKNGILLTCDIKLCNVYIDKNYDYDEIDILLKKQPNSDLNKICKLLDCNNSHELIEKLMINSNKYIGELLYNYNNKFTILRVHNIKEDMFNNKYIENNKLNDYLKFKNYESAYYEKNNLNPFHKGLNIKYYTHYTSPIRRFVDIVNHINIKKYLLNESLLDIDNNNINKVNKINKNIKKFNRDCILLDLCKKLDINNYKTNAFIIDKTSDKLILYIDEFNLEYKKKTNTLNYNIFDRIEINIYIIKDNDKLKDKVMLNIL